MNDENKEQPPVETSPDGCYQCGSPEGNVAKLCPKCTQERLSAKRARQEQEHRPQRNYDQPLEEDSDSNLYLYVQAGIFTLFVLFVGWIFLFSAYGPGWGLSRPEYAYKKCMHKITSELQKVKDATNSDDPGERALGALGSFMAHGLSTNMCDAVREKCKVEPYGETCTAVINSM